MLRRSRCRGVAASLRFLPIAFAVILLALIVVWLPRAVESEGDPVIEEAEEMVRPEPLSPEQKALDRELSAIGGNFAGHVGIAVRRVGAERTVHFNGLELFPQQSVSKLWVAMAALDQADRGRLALDEPVVIGAEDLTLFHQPIRDIVTARGSFRSDYADLLERALTRSDNTANDRLLRRVGGPDAVERFLDRHGLGSIRFGADERTKQSAIAGLEWSQALSRGSAFYDARDDVPEAQRRNAFETYLADPIDGAAPVAIAEALVRLAKGDLLSETSTHLLLDTLERTRSGPNRLKGGAPSGWTVRHKTGTGQFFDGQQSGYNDVGLLTSPDGTTYAVVVMIARTRVPTLERMAMMQEVVRAVTRHDASIAEEEGRVLASANDVPRP